MTIQKETIVWYDGVNILKLFPANDNCQYKYIDGHPCVTFGISFENKFFKGVDIFTLFDDCYYDFLKSLGCSDNIRLDDAAADTQGYVEFCPDKYGKIAVKGQLGSSFSDCCLKFSFNADQTIFDIIRNSLSL